MNALQHLVAPKALLAPRFLNRDGASVLVERLDQSTLVDLHNWYVDRDGGNDGQRLLHAAPFVDMWLAALEPPVLLHEATGPEMAGAVHFIAGLGLGAALVDEASEDPLFPISPDLDDALETLGGAEITAETLTGGSPQSVLAEMRDCHRSILAAAPALHIVICTAYRLVHEGERMARRRPREFTNSRFFFFLGLIAAGLHVPDPNGDLGLFDSEASCLGGAS